MVMTDDGQVLHGLRRALSRGAHPVSYTHLRAHETVLDLVCRLLLEKKNKKEQLEVDNLLTTRSCKNVSATVYTLDGGLTTIDSTV